MVLVVCLKEYCLKCYPEVIILIPSLDQSSMTLQERVSVKVLLQPEYTKHQNTSQDNREQQ